MKFISIITLLLSLAIPVRAHDGNLPVHIFDTEILLPSKCVLFARPSIIDGSYIKYICDGFYEDDVATISITKYDRSKIESMRTMKQTLHFDYSKLGVLHYYKYMVKSTTYDKEEELTYTHALCNEEVCLGIYGDSDRMLSIIKPQLRE